VHDPLKQGLKQKEFNFNSIDIETVEVHDPLKQGLKQ